ncbi:hypothetical protein [Halalkalibacter lacteus]|uniref:hypothetical protein n=1 Tax=Halalkalibacter lacteus TaxID=3090663 RepID=UPI002FC9323E
MLSSAKIRSWFSFLNVSYLVKNERSVEGLRRPLDTPDIAGEVYSVEEQWLFINGEVYVDITAAYMVDEEEKQLVVKDIREGDNVIVWIVESEIIKTYPALGTADYIQRKNEI